MPVVWRQKETEPTDAATMAITIVPVIMLIERDENFQTTRQHSRK